MAMHKYTLREIQLCELNILKTFAALCEKHGLYYVLCGGTLLGAIRHKGFIPWDDDIDVMMPRPDYERLLELAADGRLELPDYYTLSSPRNADHILPFAKLYDLRTTSHENFFNADGGGHHVWIDIFHMDGAPSDKKKLMRLARKHLLYKKLLMLSTSDVTKGRTFWRRMFKLCFGFMFHAISPRWMCKKIEELSRSYGYEGSEFVACLSWGYGAQERIHKKEFATLVKVEFEGQMFNAPSNYDEYLSNLYGDYMKLPPVEKRVCHETETYGE